MTNGGSVGLERARGEIRYRCHHRNYALAIDLARSSTFEDEHVRIEVISSTNRMRVCVMARDRIEVDVMVLYFERRFRDSTRFFLNGYQSWTDSREFSAQERILPFPQLLRPILERVFRTNHYGDYDLVPVLGRHLHGFTYFYVRPSTVDAIDFIGSLSEAEGFTVFRVLPEERRIIVQKDVEGLVLAPNEQYMAFDLYVEAGTDDAVFANYLRVCHDVAGRSQRSATLWTGWTSWYYHYTNIHEKIILRNLEAFEQRRIPIDVFQIDDGWQAAVGDWLEVNEKFPHGLRPIVERIHAAGYRAGLWLAPLVAEQNSRLVAEHPEWLLRDDQGNPVPAGSSPLWSGDFYGLDVYHEGLREYLTNVFRTILDTWGFDLVKLDFLYGACLIPGNGKTRGTKMVDTMDFLRRLVGEKYILGCGVPIGPAIGRVDICRIGPDVGHEWTNTLTRGLHMRETISTVTALENAIGRRHLSGHAFSNDPDVFFLRPLSFAGEKFDPFVALQELRWGKRIPLTATEQYTLFLLNNIFGRLVFTSDDIHEYSEPTFALYSSSFPLQEKRDLRVRLIGSAPAFGEIGGCYEIRFRIGEHRYLTYANLANESVTFELPVSGFSQNMNLEATFLDQGQPLTLAPHMSVCILEETSGDVVLLGSESHLFPGSDIVEWSWDGRDDVTLVRDERARGRGRTLLGVSKGISGLRVNGRFVSVSVYLGRERVIAVNWE